MKFGLPSIAPLTIAGAFRSVAARHPSRPAVVTPEARLSFAELDRKTDALALALAAHGVPPGATIGTLLPDGLAMIELLIATAKSGVSILTMNWRLAAPELTHIMEDADPALTFVSRGHEQLARDAGPDRRIIVVPDDGGIDLASSLGGYGHPAQARAADEIGPADDWLLLYSSGTTGSPKGCRHSQGGYYINALSCMAAMGFRETDRALLVQPLFHVGGLHIFLAVHLAGGCVIVPPRGLDHESMIRLVSAEKVTFQTVPVLDPRGYGETHRRLALPTQLRLLHAGGGMHPPELLQYLATVFKSDMLLGYGQTEGGGLLCLISLADQLHRPTSCGKPLPHLDARIVDDTGNDLADGAHGELVIRGPSTTIGYLNLPEATREALSGGWLRTGDIFWRDGDGFLHFAGRKKELIKSGGENIYPAEVELALLGHPAVRQCCVVGVPDRRYGEAVKAFVVLADGQAPSPRDIADWCRTRIAGYKRPRFVEFVDQILCDFQAKPQRALLVKLPVSTAQATDQD